MRVRILLTGWAADIGDAPGFLRAVHLKSLLQGLAQTAHRWGHKIFIKRQGLATRQEIPPGEVSETTPLTGGFSEATPLTGGFVGYGASDSTADHSSPADASVSFGELEVSYNAVSNTGLVRTRNEDACGLFIPPDAQVLNRMGVLAVLADGMGGHECGDRASNLVLESVGRSYYESHGQNPGDALVQAVKAAHEAVMADASKIKRDMGSTCSALLFHGNDAYAVHVGDSRIYRWRSSGLEQLSSDDSMVAEMVRRGMLTAEQARRHPDRSVLLNAVGQSEELTVSRASTPCELRDGDRFLICSDGLHGLVENEEIAELMSANHSSLAAVNGRLLDLALARGGGDNISMVLMRVHHRNGDAEA
jgi:protein phosphatase